MTFDQKDLDDIDQTLSWRGQYITPVNSIGGVSWSIQYSLVLRSATSLGTLVKCAICNGFVENREAELQIHNEYHSKTEPVMREMWGALTRGMQGNSSYGPDGVVPTQQHRDGLHQWVRINRNDFKMWCSTCKAEIPAGTAHQCPVSPSEAHQLASNRKPMFQQEPTKTLPIPKKRTQA